MHSHGLDLKKRGAFLRLGFRRRLGLAVPDYGYRLGDFPRSRTALELVISSLFLLLGSPPARACLQWINPVWLGRFFVRLRTVWKRTTRGIKLHELHR